MEFCAVVLEVGEWGVMGEVGGLSSSEQRLQSALEEELGCGGDNTIGGRLISGVPSSGGP